MKAAPDIEEAAAKAAEESASKVTPEAEAAAAWLAYHTHSATLVFDSSKFIMMTKYKFLSLSD